MYLTGNEEVEILKEVILRKKFFRNHGPNKNGHCDQFEHDFALKMETNHCLMVTSGTNALICALKSLNLNLEDEVLIPYFTFFATAVAVVNANATPVIVNIDNTLSIDPIDIERKISKHTKAIIAVHMDGHPCDMGAIKKIATKYNLIIIEDVAQSCGGSFKGKMLGTFGEVGCFSFNSEKIISCGEGGAIITNSREIFEKSLCIQDACCSFGPTKKDEFTIVDPFIGQSMRVSEISGALMSIQLKRLDGILIELKKRQQIILETINDQNLLLGPINDLDGDCGTSLNFILNDPIEVKEKFQQLLKKNIQNFPQLNRLAHNSNQWIHLIQKERPLKLYNKKDYFHSFDLLARCLKINIPFDLTLDQTEIYARGIKEIIYA